jgi:hypothetical protein
MNSVIIELQREALDKNIRVSDLLRKALVVAHKLKLTEFQEWIEKELYGYKDEVPDYRIVTGKVRAWNPYNGWIPVIFDDPKEAEILSKRPHGQSVAEIEELVRRSGSGTTLHMPFPEGIRRKLCQGTGFQTEVSLFVDHTLLVRTLDAVRNIILNWALKLEEKGVLGEGMAFSENEKKAAFQNPQNINYFYGPVQSPQIAQGNQQAIQVSSTFILEKETILKFIKELHNAIQNIELDPTKKLELESEMATVQAQVSSPNPKKSIVRESLSSIKTILEGAGGSAVGQLLMEAGKMLLG